MKEILESENEGNNRYLLDHVQLYVVINQKLQDKNLEWDFLDEFHWMVVDDDCYYSH